MKLNTFWKGFIMAIVGFVATMISHNTETLSVWYVVIVTSGFTLWYLGKNALLPSTSGTGLNWQDALSGLLIAIGMGVMDIAASFIVAGQVDWPGFWGAIAAVIIGYFTKTVPSKAK